MLKHSQRPDGENLSKDHAPVFEMDSSTNQNGLYLLYIKGENRRAVVERISLIKSYSKTTSKVYE